MNEFKFNIIILFYNKSKLTIRCFENLVRTFPENSDFKYRITMVDNGSDPIHSEEVERRIGILSNDGFMNRNVTVEFLSLEPNRGFGAGMNHGLKNHFKYNSNPAVCLSNDVELDGDFIEQFRLLTSGNSCDGSILCPQTFFLMDKSKLSYTHGMVTSEKDDLILSHEKDNMKGRIVFPEYYPAAATIWTKTAFDRIGGFNEAFYCYWEDVELSFRCRRSGVDLISVPGLKIYHLGRGTTSGKNSYYNHYIRGKEIMKNLMGMKEGI
jgi:GT2 family glycosyltransferase